MNNFAIIGVSGYIVPRHLKAIKSIGGNLVVAMDKNDAAGVLDSYFPEAEFYTNFEEFYSSIYLHSLKGKKIDYLVICSPNYMHKSHVIFGLANNMNIICEKPLCLTQEDLEEIKMVEAKTGKKVYNIVQLRKHPAIIDLKQNYDGKPKEIELSFIAFRGAWYFKSWKMNEALSGGIPMNLGIHFFDMLFWIFGKPVTTNLLAKSSSTYKGEMKLATGSTVKWILSIDKSEIPKEKLAEGKTTFRSIKIDGKEFDISDGGVDLHTEVYKSIKAGNGNEFEISEIESALKFTSELLKYSNI